MRLKEYWNQGLEQSPHSHLVIAPDGTPSSRQEINTRANETFKKLEKLKLPPKRIAILHGENSVQWLANFIACLLADLVIVPADWSLREDEVEKIALQLGASVYLKNDTCVRFENARKRSIQKSDIVLGKLTSGSTGSPKCIFFTDEQMIADGKRIIAAMGIRPEDLNMGAIPWGHSYALGNIILPLIIQGTATTWSPSPFPHEISTTIAKTKASVFPSVPTLLKALVQSDIELDDLKSLRLTISAGSRLLPQVAQDFKKRFGLSIHNFYGSTETGGICYDPTGDDSQSGESIGKLMPGVSFKTLPKNRFAIQSASVFTYGNRRVKAESQGTFLVSDTGILTTDNRIILGERVKGFAKIGGKRIGLSEVEAQLKKIDGVSNALVFEVEHDGESKLVAAIETEQSRKEMIASMKTEIPRRIMRPKTITLFKTFPTTTRGKIDTQAIRQQTTS